MIKYIPYPMTVGFTAGIAVIIGVSQLKDLLGVDGSITGVINQIENIHPQTALIGFLSLFIIFVWQKINKTLPGSIIAILVSTLIVSVFGIDTPTIDATGIRAFEEMIDKIKKDNIQIMLSGVRHSLKDILSTSGIVSKIGDSNIFSTIEEALPEAQKYLS